MNLLQPNAWAWAQTYGYDAANRLQSIGSPAGAFTGTFKGPGNLATNLALPKGAAITNAFDSVGKVSRLLVNSGLTVRRAPLPG